MDIYNVSNYNAQVIFVIGCISTSLYSRARARAPIKPCTRNFKVNVFFVRMRILMVRLPYAAHRFPEFRSHCG